MYEMTQLPVTRPGMSRRTRLTVAGLVVSAIAVAGTAIVMLNDSAAGAVGLCGGG